MLTLGAVHREIGTGEQRVGVGAVCGASAIPMFAPTDAEKRSKVNDSANTSRNRATKPSSSVRSVQDTDAAISSPPRRAMDSPRLCRSPGTLRDMIDWMDGLADHFGNDALQF